MIPSRIDFTQEMHCCGPTDKDPWLSLQAHDGGAGSYLVLEATEWAFGSEAELVDFYVVLKDTWEKMVKAQERKGLDDAT